MPAKVFDTRILKRGMKALLQVAHRLAGVSALNVGEHVWGFTPYAPQLLQRGVRVRIEGYRVWFAALRAWHANYTIQPIDPVRGEFQDS